MFITARLISYIITILLGEVAVANLVTKFPAIFGTMDSQCRIHRRRHVVLIVSHWKPVHLSCPISSKAVLVKMCKLYFI